MLSYLPLFCSLLIVILLNATELLAAQTRNNSEVNRQALLCFKSGISSDPLGVLHTWRNNSLTFCSWQGVTCSRKHPHSVVSLDLPSAHLSGGIHGCIANLTSLSQIDLTGNLLSGVIPDEMGRLADLQTLMLASNNLQGNIPDSLGSSTYLRFVNLADNTLTGGIPHLLANSISLDTLNISRNNLVGEIPATLFHNSSALTVVDLQKNSLTGHIPPFSNVTALKYLSLTQNFLSGGIPPSIGNVSSLTSILLGQNRLSGSIPDSLSHLPKLLELDISFNSLFGYIPLSIYNMSSLKYFSIGSNDLVGQIPSYIGYSLPNLHTLIMQSNKLDGLIPFSLTSLLSLQVLDLSNNSLHGPIPSFGSLVKLRQVILGRNWLEAHDWAFLASLANCTQLTKLSLERNILNGSLPRSLVNLSPKLESLVLGSNQISGSIPVEISNFVNLTFLSMENNSLSGNIPPTIGKLNNLIVLDLSKNKLSGQIPSSICNITPLSKLYLDDNNLNGNIPISFSSCLQLLQLNISANNLDGFIPKEIFSGPPLSLGVDFSHNNLIGKIPDEVGNMVNLALLNVSNNLLFGMLPTSLGHCVTLLFLRMEENRFEGDIPSSFTSLTSIQLINLSRNNLSGRIPEFFEGLSMLEQLDLSYNNFEGPVPLNGWFRNSNVVVLDGNTKLCATVSMLTLPICDGTVATDTKRLLMRRIGITAILVPVCIIGFLLLCLVVSFWMRRAGLTVPRCNKMLSMHFGSLKKRTEVNVYPIPIHKKTLNKVSYSDILKATNCFSSIHQISSTRTGSVYVGRFMSDRSLAAVKVFNLNEPGAYESYFIECEVLRNTRHRNIMRPVTLCSTLDTENHEFKALVFMFMANGSLDRWLHSEHYYRIPERVISLGQRICIAADVASALDYIHNQLTPPLIHCDLKPSNILLDDDMTACLGDFGSAKFLFPDLISPESLVGVGGTIGYMAPEYGMCCEISTGGDVYSFGVLLLEMLTGKEPTDDIFVDGLNLHNFVDSMFPDRVAEIVDPNMPHEEHHVCLAAWMQRCVVPLVALGLSCSREFPKDRPGMRDVSAKLCAIKEAYLGSLD